MTTGELVKHAREAIADSGQQIDDRGSAGSPAGCPTCTATSPTPRSTAASPRGSATQSGRCTTWRCPLFGPIVEHLGAARLLREGRVAVEKPFGHDLASARELNARLHRLLRRACGTL